MTLPAPACRLGYPVDQAEKIVGEDRVGILHDFLCGQTMTICQQDPQREWIDDADAPGGMRVVDVGPSLCGEVHGSIVYPWDLEQFLAGRPVID